MKYLLFDLKVLLALSATLALAVGCGQKDLIVSSNSGADALLSMTSVRTMHDQLSYLEEATGIARNINAVQTLLTDRGAMLSPTGGNAISASFLQGSMDLTAAFCVAAATAAAGGAAQKVFPSYVRFTGTPSKAIFPDETVVIPLASHLLLQFSGQVPPESEVKLVTAAINGFLEEQRTANNNANGIRRAMEASCVLTAASFQSALSR